MAAGASWMRHGALAWTAHGHRRRPLLFVRSQQPVRSQWSTTRISSTSRQPLEDSNEADHTENSSNLNDTLWDDDMDGIGSLFGGASSVPPPVPTMKSSMLQFVTQYLQKNNASDATEKTTESTWTIPEFTIVSSPELDIDDNDDDNVGTNNNPKNTSSPTETTTRSLQGFTRQRVYSDLLAKKAKSLLEPNPIFERYKNSTLVANNNNTESFNGAVKTSAATVFPSAEHCIGFWRWLQSPTGFAVESSDASGSRSGSTVSDNLILRVDGTIAGGPILDAEFRHKPSGGQWDLSRNPEEKSLLRISLHIPPAKQRMLVLQGILRQEPPPSVASSSPSLSHSGVISCRGTVWIQDIVPLASLEASQHRRDPVGTFAMVKLDSVANRESYTITIPRNVRPMD
jgi:hypothetical protein